MGFQLTTKDFIAYFRQTMKIIADQKDYITELDAATGDGDHWVNVYMGFEKINELSDEIASLSLSDMFKKVGMTMFSAIGGSSGALYGSGYLAASRSCAQKTFLDVRSLCEMYDAMLSEIMKRGKTQPGQKTMVDTLHQALAAYRSALEAGVEEKEVIHSFIQGAKDGAQSTKDMEAVKGRASYRNDKGVGFLDPGAVTMAMQLESMGNYILHLLD